MRLCLLYAFLLFCGLSQGQPSESVKQLMLEQEKCWNNGDIRGFMSHYWKSDSLKFIGSKGVTYGWQATLDNYLKSYPTKEQMGLLTFTLIEVSELSNESVYVIGRWHLEKQKSATGHFTLLWKLIEGHWVIVSDHTS